MFVDKSQRRGLRLKADKIIGVPGHVFAQTVEHPRVTAIHFNRDSRRPSRALPSRIHRRNRRTGLKARSKGMFDQKASIPPVYGRSKKVEVAMLCSPSQQREIVCSGGEVARKRG
ncbi:hypothetical protein BDD14_5467 [Edaphobacter modestus]|uniref:Uncharacterized protein n=1 Tax=Edaphobacter modestus TaxID=388466 RepID=A0A4Q7YE67_9BACT|nr:hypothetical protein BDD14_5467 [Edaphobacter modestus]